MIRLEIEINMIQDDNKITAKTLALSLDETDEYEYLTGEKKIIFWWSPNEIW